MTQPRLRVFAGPNGSGKSTLNSVIKTELLGMYINADEIEKEIRSHHFLTLNLFSITTTNQEIFDFFSSHPLIEKAKAFENVHTIKFIDDKLFFADIEINSYIASICADFIRHKLLEYKVSFTFETVMSSTDKVDFLEKAKLAGYRVYLYFIATEDPIINISRVENRVKKGGHSVPKDKIVSRYYRSLEQLRPALQYTNRAYVFDNSKDQKVWLAEITEGKEVEFKTDLMPFWIKKYLLKNIDL